MRGIVPQKVKGFRDITSSQNALRELIISKATEVYRRFGFSRFDTPVLEYAECLKTDTPGRHRLELRLTGNSADQCFELLGICVTK